MIRLLGKKLLDVREFVEWVVGDRACRLYACLYDNVSSVRGNKSFDLNGFVVDVVGCGLLDSLLVSQFPVTKSDTNHYSNNELAANNNRLISDDAN